MTFIVENIDTIGSILIAIVGFIVKQYGNKEKSAKNKEGQSSLDEILDNAIELLGTENENDLGTASEFNRLKKLVEAINRKYNPRLIGVVKVNGVEKLIIDLSNNDKLANISKSFGTSLFEDANDDLMLDEGLYIPVVVKYKGDDDFAKALHKEGVSEAYIIPFLENGLMTGYLILGYTEVNSKPKLSIEEFTILKNRINKVRINFNKT